MKQYYVWVKPSWGPLTGPPPPVFFTVLITLSPFIALTTQNTWNADALRRSLWYGGLYCIKHAGDKKWRQGGLEGGSERTRGEGRERRNKADAIWRKSIFLATHGRAYCSEETEGNSRDPTKGGNTGHRWDSQHYQFSHCSGSRLKPSLSAALSTFLNSCNPYMPWGRRCFIYLPQHIVGSLRDKSTYLMYLWVLPFRHTKGNCTWNGNSSFYTGGLVYHKKLRGKEERSS